MRHWIELGLAVAFLAITAAYVVLNGPDNLSWFNITVFSGIALLLLGRAILGLRSKAS